MIIFIYRKIANLIRKTKIFFVAKQCKRSATFRGTGHNFKPNTRIYLLEGATKNNIQIFDNVEICGTIKVSKHGKLTMGEWSILGNNSIIDCVNNISIGKDTAISNDVIITDNNAHPINPEFRRKMRHIQHGSEDRARSKSASSPIKIGENVLVGEHSRICKGVTIGDNAIIAASSVVTKDVPSNAIAAGNPARIVKENIDLLPPDIF